ncbi:hypothetical protein MferCBS49748_006416 [Microsporum ferrugineum]
MPFNIFSVAANASFTTISTGITHYLGKKPVKTEPAAHFSYHSGLKVVRQFLEHAARHTVEELQAFTGQKVPPSYWVATGSVIIPTRYLESASHLLVAQLGLEGISLVGGSKWWQWRDTEAALVAEWLETRRDYNDRRARNAKSNHEIILAGDSSGGGMVMSMLVTLRDQNVPLPAGAVLISPWVDLTHSFPSVSGTGVDDYIPICGFMHRPSKAWPPPNLDEYGIESTTGEKILNKINSPPVMEKNSSLGIKAIEDYYTHQARAAVESTHVDEYSTSQLPGSSGHRRTAQMIDEHLRVDIDGATVEIKDQIHLYTTNKLISHPLVSPVLQPSLGGLPPLLIISGGGELLRDEQIYIAHKAANPTAYPPSDEYLDRYDPDREILSRYKPTYVQLQVWNNLCHVAPTLSFTRPAKYIYRAVAQFSAWALSRAQESSIDIPESSPASSGELLLGVGEEGRLKKQRPEAAQFSTIGKAGDSIPPFKNHMIRQLVDSEGNLFPLPDEHELSALQVPRNHIGVPKPTPVRRWLAAKGEWDTKFAKEKDRLQNERLTHIPLGIDDIAPGDCPPPSSLAAQRGVTVSKVRQPAQKSMLLSLWNKLGAIHDVKAVQKEKKEHVEEKFPTLWRGGVNGEQEDTVNITRPSGQSNAKVVTDIGQSNESQRDFIRSGKTTPDASVPQIWRSHSSEEFERTRSTPRRTSGSSQLADNDEGHSEDNRPATEPPLDEASIRTVRHSKGVISPSPVLSDIVASYNQSLESTSLPGPYDFEYISTVNKASPNTKPMPREETILKDTNEATQPLAGSSGKRMNLMRFDFESATGSNLHLEPEPFPTLSPGANIDALDNQSGYSSHYSQQSSR